MLRAAEAEAQAEAARALIGADMGPDVNSATSPVHGARNHKGCTEVAKRKAPDLFVQVRGSETLDINYSLPLDGFSSAVPSFQLRPVLAPVSSRVPPDNTMSRFVGFGDKSWDNFKNFFQTQGFEFLFLSQGTRRAAFGGSISPKTPVLKLKRSLAREPPASTASESALVVFEPSAKPQVTGLWYRWTK